MMYVGVSMSIRVSVLFAALTGLIVPLIDAQVLTSVEVDRVLNAESNIANMLDDYIVQERRRLDKLEEIARDYREHSLVTLQHPEKSIGDLVSTFITMKRFTVDWQKIKERYIVGSVNSSLIQQISDTADQLFPANEDMEGTARALMRLQDTYALTPADMAQGHVEGMMTSLSSSPSPKLSPDDCFVLGRIAYAKEDYYHAISWMEHVLSEMKAGATTHNVDIEDVYDHLNYAYYLKKDVKRARVLVKEWLDLNPNAHRALNNLKHYNEVLGQQGPEETSETCTKETCSEATPKNERTRDEWQASPNYHKYEALCRGEEPVPVKDKHRLYCTYRYPQNKPQYPPLREEILNFDPRLLMFHDVLTEAEMEMAREKAIPKLHRSGIFRSNPDEPVKYTEHRTSKTSWIFDSEHKLIDRISQKSSIVSGLTRDTVEQLQIVSYGIAGHYEPHYDFSRDGEVAGYDPEIGNRIATVIFYLADVDAGGATVFPEIGARVAPRKGSCAVWFNLLKNGKQDYRTLHAGCPVLTGSKWIGTKWYHEQGQEFVRKCDLDPAK